MTNFTARCYIVGIHQDDKSGQEKILGDGDPGESMVDVFDRVLGDTAEEYTTLRVVYGKVFEGMKIPGVAITSTLRQPGKSWVVRVNGTCNIVPNSKPYDEVN